MLVIEVGAAFRDGILVGGKCHLWLSKGFCGNCDGCSRNGKFDGEFRIYGGAYYEVGLVMFE